MYKLKGIFNLHIPLWLRIQSLYIEKKIKCSSQMSLAKSTSNKHVLKKRFNDVRFGVKSRWTSIGRMNIIFFSFPPKVRWAWLESAHKKLEKKNYIIVLFWFEYRRIKFYNYGGICDSIKLKPEVLKKNLERSSWHCNYTRTTMMSD